MSSLPLNKIICGDALTVLKKFPSESIDCCVTSPPYFHLRDYRVKGQIGLEPTIEEYLEKLSAIFDEVKRVLKPAGTCWVNLGDTYGGSGTGMTYAKRTSEKSRFLPSDLRAMPKVAHNRGSLSKSLLQIPSRFALLMTERGWLLRNEIIWHKPNCLPSPVKDRFTVDFEKLFFFVKNRKYYFEQQLEPVTNPKRLQNRYFNPVSKRKWDYRKDRSLPINPASIEKSRRKMLRLGRNKRSVWRIPPAQFRGNHFAVFPEKLVETPILAGCPEGGIVLDPFMGSGTTVIVAKRLNRKFVGIEINNRYIQLALNHIKKVMYKNIEML
jgi:site-specific DNA-methyltransferase (adenine-specific)